MIVYISTDNIVQVALKDLISEHHMLTYQVSFTKVAFFEQ